MNIEVHIEKIAFGGDGLGTVDGKTCFVEGGLPGETVIVKVTQDKKNFLRAKIVRLLKSSPHRVEAPCAHVKYCGGCQYQHVSYLEELKFKETQIEEIFKRAFPALSPRIESIVHPEDEYGYRNSVTLHRTSEDSKKPQFLGFISDDNHSKAVVQTCLISDPRLQSIFKSKFLLKKNIEKVSFKVDKKGDIITDQEDLFLRIPVGNEELLVHSKGFFQNNLEITKRLTEKIAEWFKGSGCRTFFDLYAGVGTFSFLSAGSAQKIYCIEENPYSIHALRMNKEERKFSQVEIIAGRVEKAFPPVFPNERNGKTLVFMDPPRQGIERSLAAYLSGEGVPDALIYLSCDPLTLVRDLKIILSKGCYEMENIAPFDMFPRTKHIETAVLLRKKIAVILPHS